MSEEQKNNPLHGLKLKTMITELVDFYGWDVLDAALRLDCFYRNPSIESCYKFLKKTEWASEKVENFYLYKFKRMPKASAYQFELKPRERGFEEGVLPKEPQKLTVEQVEEMREQAAANYAAKKKRGRSQSYKSK